MHVPSVTYRQLSKVIFYIIFKELLLDLNSRPKFNLNTVFFNMVSYCNTHYENGDLALLGGYQIGAQYSCNKVKTFVRYGNKFLLSHHVYNLTVSGDWLQSANRLLLKVIGTEEEVSIRLINPTVYLALLPIHIL